LADTQDTRRLGFVGLGIMGGHMALRLLDAGYSMTVYNRDRSKTRPFAQRGANVVETPREVAAASDVVISMVRDDDALRAVMFGDDGILAGTESGVTLIDMSSVSPNASRAVAQNAQTKGVRMIDSPVSGSTPQAEQGTLAILIGGDRDVFEDCKPILQHMGKGLFYMGGSGMGATMKLVVNTLLGTQMQTLAEAMILGLKAGIAQDTLLDTLGQMSHITAGQKAKMENVRTGQYPTQFPLALMYKDYGLVASLARELAVPMPVTAAAQQICAVEQARGRDEDVSAVLRLMQELAGLKPYRGE
jgi:3-hydroxyisobutyrate dehydrogenase-like beta-hydroxyacid dehydrogenase